MTRHRSDGLRKRCGCRRRDWAKCPHPWPWHLASMWQRQHYRLSLGSRITSKTEAKAEADRVRAQIRAGTFGPQASPAPVTLGQLFAVYFEPYVRVHRARVANEESSRAVILRTVLPTADGSLRAFADWPITDITADTLERFKEARLANKTGGRGRVAIRGLSSRRRKLAMT